MHGHDTKVTSRIVASDDDCTRYFTQPQFKQHVKHCRHETQLWFERVSLKIIDGLLAQYMDDFLSRQIK